MLYVVTHDSKSPADHEAVAAYIESIATSHWIHWNGVWFIESGEPGVVIRKGLADALNPGAKIVVAMLAGFAAWQGFNHEDESWLARNL